MQAFINYFRIWLFLLCLVPASICHGLNLRNDANGSLNGSQPEPFEGEPPHARALRTVCKIGSVNAISVSGVGNSEGGCQWRKNGAEIPGATSDTLFFPSITTDDLATYTVLVTTPNGSIESNAVTLKLDSDGDGLADDWEIANFTDLTKTGAQDTDGDGSSNAQELADGTNPNNAAEARVALTMMNLPNGSVTVDPPDLRPLKGSTVTLTATANSGVFKSWTGSVSGTTPTLTVTMDGPKAVGAIFEEVITWGGFTGRPALPTRLQRVTGLAIGYQRSFAFDSFGNVTGWGSPWLTGTGSGGDGGDSGATFDRIGRVTSAILPVPASIGHVVKLEAPGASVLTLSKEGVLASWVPNNVVGVPNGAYCDIASLQGGGIALKLDGTVVAWGSFVPKPPVTLNSVKAIAAGTWHCVALKRDGTVVCWADSIYGSNQGQLDVPAGLTDVVAISCGNFHTLAMKADGTVVAWGANTYGQCTIPSTATQAVAISASDHDSGIIYPAPNATNPDICAPATLVAGVGYPLSVKLMAKGSPTSLRAEGLPAGVTLNPDTGTLSGTPQTSGDFRVFLSATNAHATANRTLDLYVLPQAPLHAWGTGGSALIPHDLRQIASYDCGDSFCLVALKDGTVRLGGSYGAALVPPVGLTDVVGVSGGSQHMAVVKRDGTVVNWGNSTLAAKMPAGLRDVVQVDVGVGIVLALRSNGSVTAWGSTAIANAPTSGIVQVAAFGGWGLGLTSAGTIHWWGSPGIPGTPPEGLTGVVKIAASDNHALALKSDGTVVGFGLNNYGQTTIPAGLTDVIDVVAGGNFSMALRSNGQLVTWGRTSWSATDGVIPSPDIPAGLALSAGADQVVMLTRSEPSVQAPHLVMPAFLVAHSGAPYQTRVIAQNLPISFSANGLPPGLSIDPATGVLSGTPTIPGSYPVSFSATNPSGTGTHDSVIIVTGATTYEQWAAAYGLPANADVSTDTDGDGLSDLAEYALNRNPLIPDAAGAFLGPNLPGVPEAKKGISFSRPPSRTDVTYEVQSSADLEQWITVALGKGSASMFDALDSDGLVQTAISPSATEIAVLAINTHSSVSQFVRLRFRKEGSTPANPPVYDLRAEDYLDGQPWLNRGSAGGSFTVRGSPKAVTFGGAYAVSFNGADSFVGPETPASLQGGTAHTVEFWVYNGSANNLETMISFPGGVIQSLRYGYGTNGLNGAMAQRFTPNFGWDPSFTTNAPGGVVPAVGQWHHLVFVYASSNAKFYVDGALHRSVGIGMSLPATIPILGANGINGGDYFTGLISNFRVHSRAMTAAEIAETHTAERDFHAAPLPAVPLSTPPSHRYSFGLPNGVISEGATFPDSEGGSPLTLRGTGAESINGQLDLPGGNQSTAAYLEVPNGLIPGSTDVTLEFWFTPQALSNYPRLIEVETKGTDFLGYLTFTPSAASGANHALRWTKAGTTREQIVYGSFLNQPIHVVLTYSSIQRTWRVFHNTHLVGVLLTADGPRQIPDVPSRIGSSISTSDPNLDGKIDEFRVYPRVLTPGEIRGNFNAGPDVLTASP